MLGSDLPSEQVWLVFVERPAPNYEQFCSSPFENPLERRIVTHHLWKFRLMRGCCLRKKRLAFAEKT
jgi:hypothetical protein